jgi:hypothetical protein
MGMDPSVTGLVGGALLGAMLARNQRGVQAPPMQKPEAPPQQTRAPDAGDTLRNMQDAASSQPSTFLTGGGGIDPKKLKTIKPSLYPGLEGGGGNADGG